MNSWEALDMAKCGAVYCVSTVLAIGVCAAVSFGGSLTPPAGPVAPTPGPEPRVAINATNTPGDADSVYKITAPGSYYLTGNLTGVVGKKGIEVAAGNVSIDLMGFELLGVAGSMGCIVSSTNGTASVEIRNGSIMSWGGSGIELATSAVLNPTIENVRSRNNGGGGITVDDGARISGCHVSDNDGAGIITGITCVITECTVYDNGSSGILTGASCVITGCIVQENAGSGISTGSGASISRCVASTNGGTGISVSASSAIADCTTSDNTGDGISISIGTVSRCTAYSNGDDGITAFSGSTVIECAANQNTGDGIQLASDTTAIRNTCDSNGQGGIGYGINVTGTDNRVEGNNCTDNTIGIVASNVGNFFTRNTCTSNNQNWNTVAGNNLLVIDATGSTAAAIAGSSGGVSPGSTNPWANFSY